MLSLSVFIYRKSRREAAGGGCVTAVRTNLCLTSVTVQPDVTVQTLHFYALRSLAFKFWSNVTQSARK